MTSRGCIAAALLLCGCGTEFGFNQIESGDLPAQLISVTEPFVQAPLPRLDLLFVIDNTASMAQEQLALREEFAVLLTGLDANEITWQLGVTSTDLGLHGGRLLGAPYVLTPSTENREQALANALRVGTEGRGPEAGLAAAVHALEQAGSGGLNAGFRRADAVLHVVFVSDSDDHSEDVLADPVRDFLAHLEAEALTSGLPALASGIIGDEPAGCLSTRGAAQAGSRYHEVIAATGGEAISICVGDFATPLASVGDASVSLPVRFPLRERPVPGSVRVRVDEVGVEDWVVVTEDTEVAVVFDTPPPASSRISITYIVRLTETAG